MCLQDPKQLHQTKDCRRHFQLYFQLPPSARRGVVWPPPVDWPNTQKPSVCPPHVLCPHLQETYPVPSLQETSEYHQDGWVQPCRASFGRGRRRQRGAFTPHPLARVLPSLRTCEYCMRCESKPSDVPQSFLIINFCPLLTIFLNEPLPCTRQEWGWGVCASVVLTIIVPENLREILSGFSICFSKAAKFRCKTWGYTEQHLNCVFFI